MTYCGAMDARSIEEALIKQTHLFYNSIILDFFHFTVYKTKIHVSVSYSLIIFTIWSSYKFVVTSTWDKQVNI